MRKERKEKKSNMQLFARSLGCSNLACPHATEPVLAAGTQRPGELALLHHCWPRHHGIAGMRVVGTGTVCQAGREQFAGTSLCCCCLGGGCAVGEFSRRFQLVQGHGHKKDLQLKRVWRGIETYVGSKAASWYTRLE